MAAISLTLAIEGREPVSVVANEDDGAIELLLTAYRVPLGAEATDAEILANWLSSGLKQVRDFAVQVARAAAAEQARAAIPDIPITGVATPPE